MAPHDKPPFKRPVLCSSHQQAVWITLLVFPETAHLESVCHPSERFTCLGNGAGFGFCKQHLEFLGGLPSNYNPGPMLLYFSICFQHGIVRWLICSLFGDTKSKHILTIHSIDTQLVLKYYNMPLNHSHGSQNLLLRTRAILSLGR